MSKKVKSLLLVLCALVFAVAGIFATLAYLQDADEVNNTVTIGDIDMIMDEGHFEGIDDYGVISFDKTVRVDNNEYHLIPGVTYPKDPTIHIADVSEPAYVFVRVENGLAGLEAEDGNTIADQMEALGWKPVGGSYANVFVYNGDLCVDGKEYIVNGKVDAVVQENGLKTIDIPVFTQFKVDPAADTDKGDPNLVDFKDAKVNIKAVAIQVVGFENYTQALEEVKGHLGY